MPIRKTVSNWWNNTLLMPRPLRGLCRLGMVAPPVFAFVLVRNAMFDAPEHAARQAAFLASRAGLVDLATMIVVALACWALAARRGGGRWLLVLAAPAHLAAMLALHLVDDPAWQVPLAAAVAAVAAALLYAPRSMRAFFAADGDRFAP